MVNRFFSEVPFLRLILPFCVGILSGFATQLERSFLVVGLLIILLAVGADLILKISSKFSREWIYGILLQMILFMSGLLVVDLRKSFPDFRDHLNDNNLVIVDLVEYPEEKPKSYKIIARVRAVKDQGDWEQTGGKCLIYFRKEDNSEDLMPGDRIIFISRFSEIPFNGNPNEFNYKKYMHRHGVYKQIFLEKGSWEKIGENKGSPLLLAAVKMQNHLFQKYRKYGLKDDVLEVAGALTLGLREKLGDEIKQSYTVSGSIHILAISGLHVGILYMVLFYSLSFLKKIPYGKIVMVLVILAALWFFALLTGLSPSVLRASTMFSFVLIGQSLRRHSNVYNSLAISAFILLFINPTLISNVGFQLSYCAVLGIVIVQPRLHNLMRSRFWLIDKMSGLVAVSFAAQLATFPLSLFYFHQFPVYFWLTNIIVIPFTTIILYFGLLFFSISFYSPAAGFIGKIMAFLVNGMNNSVETIREFPLSLIDGISISEIESVALYCLVICTGLFLVRRKGVFFLPLLGSILFLLLMNLYQLYGVLRQKSVVLYNIKDVTAINFIDGRTSYMVHDAGEKNLDDQLNYYTKNHLNVSGIKKHIMFSLASFSENITEIRGGSLFFHKGFVKYYDIHLFVYSDNSQNRFAGGKKVNIDALIYSNPAGMNISSMKKRLIFDKVIISSSIPEWKARLLQEECNKSKIACHRVRNDGPSIFEL
ncbi:MAG: ComEC family competence protein [Bacteroidetes bacterium]|nr:ComEC family competence protein [Bacteroidota bacterium]